ncbi:DUF5675 family protein [Thermophagus sp. OGC60D27]|uniref:DUF5675 family protein n=1 Tax=Thermophagus sp. OGC60D27 TaxID=3458415 RepID=UPI0040382F4B
MLTAYLRRDNTGKYGTFGVLSVPEVGFSCFSAEPPWKNNRRNVSCIPPGEYIVKIFQSPKYGTIFHVTNVKGRSYILIHWGNLAGDVELGFKTHTQGCILLGKSIGVLSGQKAILNSRITVKNFMRLMKYEPFKLIIL